MTLLRALAVLSFVAACGEVHEYPDGGGGDDDDVDAGIGGDDGGGGDTTPPDTTFQVVPPALDNSTSVRFEFTANEPSTFTCQIDGGAAVACESPRMVVGLADGPHTFSVRATDLAGNVEVDPAVHGWSIDSTTPDTQIDDGPTGAVAAATARFTFSSLDAGAGATFDCALDSDAFAACTSPHDLSALAEGAHMFRVRVTDATGNADPTPAERSWTVDTVAPTVSIAQPTTPTSDATPTFTFTTGGAPTVVECRMDGATYGACSTPTTHTPAALSPDGPHTFEVRVADEAGNTATASTTVDLDTMAPTIMINTGVANGGATNDTTPTWGFSTAGSPTTIECRVETVSFGACTTSYTAPTLAPGSHVLTIHVVDAAGNESTVTRSFTLDTTPPTASFTTVPPASALDVTA
jgi:hypothetical protein